MVAEKWLLLDGTCYDGAQKWCLTPVPFQPAG